MKPHLEKNTKLKILYITVRSDIGGGPKHLYDLSRKLEKRAHIYIAAPKGEFYSKYDSIANEAIELPFRKFSLTCFWKLLKLIEKEKIDIVHSHGRGAGIYSRLLSLLSKPKVVHTFHGIHIEKNLIGAIKNAFDKLFSFAVDKYICVSQDEQFIAVNNSYSKDQNTSIILNGVDLEHFSKIKQAEKSSRHIFGYLCRFHYQKGIDIFLQFILELKDYLSDKQIKFIIQGNGEFFQAANDFITKHSLEHLIELPGFTNEPTELFEKIDYYFSFARWEGLPLSVIEAMAAKKPCLLSDVTGHQTFIAKKSALGFDLTSAQDFQKKLSNFIQSPELRDQLQLNATNFVQEDLNLEAMSNKTFALYEMAIST